MSRGLNKVVLMGHLGQDPQLKNFNNQDVCNFSVAVNEDYKDKNGNEVKQTTWHNVSVWGVMAHHCINYLEKGSKVYLEGKLRYSQDETNGVKRTFTSIVATELRFLSMKDNNNGSHTQSKPAPVTTENYVTSDDIPF